MKNYFYILFFGLPAGNAHRGSMKNYFYILFFGLSAGNALRGTQEIYLVSIFGFYFSGRVYDLQPSNTSPMSPIFDIEDRIRRLNFTGTN